MSVISITDKQTIFNLHLQRTQVRPPQTIQNQNRLSVCCENVANEERRDEKKEEEAAERDMHDFRNPTTFCSGTSIKFWEEITGV